MKGNIVAHDRNGLLDKLCLPANNVLCQYSRDHFQKDRDRIVINEADNDWIPLPYETAAPAANDEPYVRMSAGAEAVPRKQDQRSRGIVL
jgi:hypothetical protein